MANIQSQIKRNRQNAKRRLRNRNVRGATRAAIKQARIALEQNSLEESRAAVTLAASQLDRSVGRGVSHANKAARLKSRLAKRLNAMQSSAGKKSSEQ
ncbi:MAG: 30S ribosomal protein S20 [Anaerolineaceae bacterium]|nr:MAG: 30S ribosomal protein S20 [Anaerolineaceae bacterium]